MGRAELNNTLQSQKNAMQTNFRDSITGSYSKQYEEKSVQGSGGKPTRKVDVTTPKSPFTRDNETKKPIETIVPQPKLQPCDKDILRRKQQEEHENFLRVSLFIVTLDCKLGSKPYSCKRCQVRRGYKPTPQPDI